jgi:hypothetical protein
MEPQIEAEAAGKEREVGRGMGHIKRPGSPLTANQACSMPCIVEHLPGKLNRKRSTRLAPDGPSVPPNFLCYFMAACSPAPWSGTSSFDWCSAAR